MAWAPSAGREIALPHRVQISVTAWIVFAVAIGVLLAIDLLSHRGRKGQSAKAATIWTIVWIGAGLLFGLVVLWLLDARHMQDYYAAYLIEKSLSVDNLFVFLVVFRTLSIPEEKQHNVLFLGVLGALVFRALFVIAGVAALERWQWVNYVFGAILLFAAVRSVRGAPEEEENAILRWLSKRNIAPFWMALISLELTDIMFAVDSVPAALSVTHDTFVVYSSNAFAIMGLRSLYVVMAKSLAELHFLHYGIAGVLAFTGLKMIFHQQLHIPSWASILIIASIVGVAVLASLRARPPAPGTPRSDYTAEQRSG
jgi:tellurite resistance protein TerC